MFPYDTSPSGEDFSRQTRKAAQGISIGIAKTADEVTGAPGGQSPLGRGGAKPAPEPDQREGEVKRLERRRKRNVASGWL